MRRKFMMRMPVFVAGGGVILALAGFAADAGASDVFRQSLNSDELQTRLLDRRVDQTARQAARPSFKRDLLGNLVPDVRAAAAIVFDPQTGQVLW